MKLKPCPCGAVPESLLIEADAGGNARAAGDCCGRWHVVFTFNSEQGITVAAMESLADQAWNNAPRRPFPRAEIESVASVLEAVEQEPEQAAIVCGNMAARLRRLLEE